MKDKDIYNLAKNIKPFKNENELPLDEEIIIEYMDENEKFFTFVGKVEIYNNERFFITKSSSLPKTFKSLNIKAWGFLKEEKPKEKGSRVYLDFSESELEELQELLEISKQSIGKHSILLERIKKFQDKFSKVEF